MIATYFDENLRIFVPSAGAQQSAPGVTWTYGDNYNLQIYLVSNGTYLPLNVSDTISVMLYQPTSSLPYTNLAIIGSASITTDAALNQYYLINVSLYTTQLAALVQATNKVAQCKLHLIFSPVSGERLSCSADIPVAVNPDVTQNVSGATAAPSGYPPTPAGFELLANKNAASGYAGLTAGSKLTASQIPTDASLTVTGGNLSVVSTGASYFGTFTSFTVPPAGSTVNVTVNSVTDKLVGMPIILTDNVLWMNGTITLIAGLVCTVQNNGQGGAVSGTMGAGHIYTGGGPKIDGVATDFHAGDGTFKPIPVMTATAAGLGPTPPNDGTKFLSGLATFTVPPSVAASTPGYVPSPAGVANQTFITDGLGNPKWANGTAGPAAWAASSTILAWNPATSTYTGTAPASVVTYLGGTWVAVAPVTGTAPGVTGGQWVQVAAPGAAGAGSGDMTKSVYDTALRGYVDHAVLADKASQINLVNVTGAGTAAALNVPVTGNATAGQVVLGSDTRLIGGGGGSGGSGAWPVLTPDQGLDYFDHFSGSNPPDVNVWQSATSGATIAISTFGQAASFNAPGVIALATTGATVGNRAILAYGADGPTGVRGIIPGLGVLDLFARVAYDTLGTAAQSMGNDFGLIVDDGAGNIQSGIYISYDPSLLVSNWQCTCVAATVATTSAAAGAPTMVAQTFYNLHINVNAAWTSVTFYINGVLVATIATHIPTVMMAAVLWAKTTVGTTNRTQYCDLFRVRQVIAVGAF